MKRSPLKRKTPLRAKTGLRPVGERGKAKQQRMKEVRSILEARSGGRCEACRKLPLPGCNGRYEDTHHITRASKGGTEHPANLLAVSRFHHQHIHNNPKESMLFGLLKGNNND